MITSGLGRILKTFGLRKYEVEVYTRLMKSGPLFAREVADLAGVPNPRIYSVLSTLKKRGYVLEIKGKPSVYDAQHPRHILYTELAKLRKNIDFVLEEAEQEYEMRKDQRLIASYDAWTTYGEKGVTAELLRLIKSASKEVVLLIRDLDWCLEEGSIKMLKNKKRNKLLMRVIGIDADLVRETADIFKIASGGQVKYIRTSNPLAPFVVADENEVLVSLKQTLLADRDDYVGITIRNKGVAFLYRKHFEELWKQAKMEEFLQ